MPHQDFPRYLAAKKSVDDRALNRAVWQSLASILPPSTPSTPLKVLETGAGIGTMIERMLEWDLLIYAEYTAIDAMPENIAQARQRLPAWGAANGWQVENTPQGKIRLAKPGRRVLVDLQCAEMYAFITAQKASQTRPTWHLLVAHAFLDLLDIPVALPELFSLLKSGGLFYFSLNFDGVTLLEPTIDPDLDAQIEALYHRTMDERIIDGKVSGDSRSGRHLFTQIQTAGAHILAAGASDWVVFAGPDGYPHDEAYFLHFIIHTIQGALQNHPELSAQRTAQRFAAWIAERHAQIERRQLVYIAHQLDFAGQVPTPGPAQASK